MQLLEHPELLLVCDRCERMLNLCSSVLLQLANERKDLCFTCLLGLKELPQAAVYYVRPNLHLTFTEDKWDSASELLLLNSLQKQKRVQERFGFGNWSSVKNHLDCFGKNFTKQSIETHYRRFYLQDQQKSPIFTDNPLQISSKNHFTPSKRRPEESPQSDQGPISSVPGYNPKRDEHLFDYDPQAQKLIADLQFLEDDSPEETQMKYQLLQEYNKRLKQRRKRQKYVNEHKMLCDEYQMAQLECSKTKLQLKNKLTPFSRFMTFQESENVLNHLALQSTLKSQIRQLLAHRSKLSDPTFQNAYQAMTRIKENRQTTHYKNAPQLKVKEIKLQPLKTQNPVKVEKQLRDSLFKISIGSSNVQITNISQF